MRSATRLLGVGLAFSAVALGCTERTELTTPSPHEKARSTLAASTDGSPFGWGLAGFVRRKHYGDHLTPDETSDLLDAVQQSGAGWVRLTAYWSLIQPSAGGPLDFTAAATGFDYTIDAAARRGLSIVVVVEGIPSWASKDGTESGAVAPEQLPAWKAFLRQMQARYAGRVRYWTILNEANCRERDLSKPESPNLFHGYSRTDTPDQRLAAYTTMLTSAAEVLPAGSIIAANPPLTAPGDDENGCIDSRRWINNALASAAGPSIGPVAGNLYSGNPQIFFDRIESNLASYRSAYPGHPFWLTEFGYPGDREARSVSDSLQEHRHGNVMYAVLRGLLQRRGSGWEKAFAYRLWGSENDDHYYDMVSTSKGADGRFVRKEPWHLYRHVALNGPDWRPIDRWWRSGDTFYTVPGEGDQSAYGYGAVHHNHWSTSWRAYRGWRPLFRCWYPDNGYNNAHVVTPIFQCNEPNIRPGYPQPTMSYQTAYGYVSVAPRPEIGLVALHRFVNSWTADYEMTTDSARAALLRSQQYRSNGWYELPLGGYAWPTGYTPQP